jgi:hypothetical protein
MTWSDSPWVLMYSILVTQSPSAVLLFMEVSGPCAS